MAPTAQFGYILHSPTSFGVLAVGILLGEMMPIKIPRRGNDEEITLSASFAMALLLAGGLGPALVAQGVASVVQDLSSGKPWWRIRFNLGQYTLSMAAAEIVMRSLSMAHLGIHTGSRLSSDVMPAMMFAAGVFFVVNTGLVGVAVSLYQGVPIRRYFRNNTSFVFVTGGVMLLVAPIVLAVVAYSVFLVPLCLAPVVAIYSSVWQGARSEHAARHDVLTGLPNRAAFQEEIEHAIRDVDAPAFVMLMDLDRFKDVNDTLGHAYGDLLLQQVAQRFQQQIGAAGQIARLGGDEFAVVGPSHGCDAAVAIARGLADSLRHPMELEHIVLDVQASVGIALFPEHGTAVETLMQKADVAMYLAKETRTGVALYDERHDHHSPAKLALTAELRTAVTNGELVAWYQPELEFGTGRVLAVEALVRWEHPRLGLLGPNSFIKMAEQTNLIKPLTERVTEVALSQVAAWRTIGLDLSVAVNISPSVLVDPEFTTRVMAALERAGLPPSVLKLEVTESALMADPEVARAALRELDRNGVEISIDDFGTGYSSLAYLVDLPVSEVKIDRSFVRRMTEGSRESIIVNSTIDLAHHLGMRAVAEGVEQPHLLLELDRLGCDAAQGHAIGRPMCEPDATRWLLESRGRMDVPDPEFRKVA
jgi:diguanylate cyclase (GGDEF)-like protein